VETNQKQNLAHGMLHDCYLMTARVPSTPGGGGGAGAATGGEGGGQ